MPEFPQLPVHVQRWLSELSDLTLEEHGAYFLTVMQMWLQPDCGMPNDPEWLRKKLHVHPQKWRRLWPVILSFMNEIDGRLYQKTLSEERQYLRDKSAKGSSNANKRWELFRANQLKNNNMAHASQHAIPDAPTPTPIKKESKKEATNGNGKGRGKPRHGQPTKDRKRIWLDVGTDDFDAYALNYYEKHHAAIILCWGGRGAWFNLNGEVTDADTRSAAQTTIGKDETTPHQ